MTVGHLHVMTEQHGTGPAGRTCGECSHCTKVRRRNASTKSGAQTQRRCTQAPTKTMGERLRVIRLRWHSRWPACGRFQASEA